MRSLAAFQPKPSIRSWFRIAWCLAGLVVGLIGTSGLVYADDTPTETPVIPDTETATPSETPVVLETPTWTSSVTPVIVVTATRTSTETPVIPPTPTPTATPTETSVPPGSTMTSTKIPTVTATLAPPGSTRTSTRTPTPSQTPRARTTPTPAWENLTAVSVQSKVFTPNGSIRRELVVTFQSGLSAGEIQVTIYDTNGRVLFHPTVLGARPVYQFRWNGRNQADHESPSGIYVYEVKAGESQYRGAMVLAR